MFVELDPQNLRIYIKEIESLPNFSILSKVDLLLAPSLKTSENFVNLILAKTYNNVRKL
jgi:hypothetical protein